MIYVFGDYEFDTQACELRRAGAPVTLAPKVYHVLAYLIQHRNRLVTKDELLEQVWPNAYVDDSAVKHCIMAARRALTERAGGPQYLKTLRGQGYRFVAVVQEHDGGTLPDEEPTTSAPVAVPEVRAAESLAALPISGPSPYAAVPPESAAAMQRCVVCQHIQKDGARFCAACGAPFGTMCSHCGAAGTPSALFCQACGQRLTDVSPAAPPPALALQSPRPPRAAPRPPVGEHKLITVLCGVVAHPPAGLAVGLDNLHSLIRAVYDLALPEVQRYAGTLQPITGDHFLALFGAPLAQEDHARRAVLAALGLQRRLHQATMRLASGEDLAVCLALHTGMVVVGSSGDDLPGMVAVVGETMTLVAALARRAQPGTILSSVATLRLVQDEVRTVPLPPLTVEGQSMPVPIHQVLEFVPRRASRAATEARARSPFLGREEELAFLHAQWTRVERGQGQVVGIVGDPGLGKTRLLEEFRQGLSARAIACLQGRCQSYGSAIPYLPLTDLLRTTWGITEADDTEAITAKGQAGLQAAALPSDTWAPPLLPLLGIQTTAGPFTELPPEVRKARTFEALHQVLLPSGRPPPRLLAIEDLHWVDATSEAYLAMVVERLAGTPSLLLVTYRPGYRPAWLDKSYATQITLQPLQDEASRHMVRAAIGSTSFPTALEHQVLAKAEGNPFFLEELAHTVVEHGGDVSDLAVPDTIQAVLAARIDRLPSADKQLLQAAAVVGREVSLPLLHALVALPEDALRERLAPLRAAEFLYETQRLPECVYTFKHALTHEVAYGSLLQEQRRILHRQVLTALEALADTPRAEQVDRLAYHAMQGEVWEKALRHLQQAGAAAMARSAHHEAALCYEQALAALRHLPQTRDTDEQTIDLHLELRNALVPLGEFTRIFAHLRDAEMRAEALHDHARLGRIAAYVTRDFYLVGDHQRAIASGQRALAVIGEDVALQVTAHLYLSYAYRALGDYQRAIDVLRQDVAGLSGARVHERFGLAALPAVSTRVSLAHSLTELGEFAEGLIHAEEALHIAEAIAHPFSLTQAYRGLGVLYFRQGDLDRAIPILERGLSVCQEAYLPLAFPVVASFLGAAYAQAGRLDDALPLLEQAVAQGTSIQRAEQHALRLVALSEGYLLAGRPQHAYPLALEALRLAQTRKEQGAQGYALQLLGALAAHGPAPEVAPVEAAYQQALALAQTLGMRPLQAHCHRGLGTLYAQTGQQEHARAALSSALALYRAMEMRFWLPPAEAALAYTS